MPAWETWSSGVLADAHQQEKSNAADTESAPAEKVLKDETTPERMAKGIERLRTQTNWMQAQLVRLDAPRRARKPSTTPWTPSRKLSSTCSGP
jgi:hypothetical protein